MATAMLELRARVLRGHTMNAHAKAAQCGKHGTTAGARSAHLVSQTTIQRRLLRAQIALQADIPLLRACQTRAPGSVIQGATPQ